MKNLKVCPGELAHGVQWRKYDKPRRITRMLPPMKPASQVKPLRLASAIRPASAA
jgi:hypothetical protein